MPEGWNRTAQRIHTDSTDFFDLHYGDILSLEGRPYLIRNSAREGRFGIDEDVKHWVKRAVDLLAERMCIVKLVFYEKFTTRIGNIEFECFRSPAKEGRILELVNDHPHFMHGVAVNDAAGNPVRVLEVITGRTLSGYIDNLEENHETYFHETLPAILENFLHCLQAILFLHERGEKHGDIRRDHILIDNQSGHYRWIDFDYNYRHRENMFSYDLFGLGNILLYIVGQGDINLHALQENVPSVLDTIQPADMNIVFGNRLANLQKCFPYIPDALNRILMHFSRAANWHYEHTAQLIEDLQNAMQAI